MDFIGALTEVGSALRKTGDHLASTATAALSGPSIPCAMADMTRSEQLWLALATYRLATALDRASPRDHPAAAGLSLLPAAAALFRQSGDPLWGVGLNPQRVVAGGEWHRVWRSTLAYATPLQAVDNAVEMYEACSRLERRWGWKAMAGATSAVSSLSGAFYVAAAKAAAHLAPASALATQYASAFAVGPSAVALGLSVVAGYDADVEEAGNGAGVQVWGARYYWAGRLVVACTVTSPGTGPSLEAHLCAAAAGLMCTYALGRGAVPAWGRRAGLGWKDLGLQAALGLTAVMVLLAQRSRASR